LVVVDKGVIKISDRKKGGNRGKRTRIICGKTDKGKNKKGPSTRLGGTFTKSLGNLSGSPEVEQKKKDAQEKPRQTRHPASGGAPCERGLKRRGEEGKVIQGLSLRIRGSRNIDCC